MFRMTRVVNCAPLSYSIFMNREVRFQLGPVPLAYLLFILGQAHSMKHL